jgi:hypothetical protein
MDEFKDILESELQRALQELFPDVFAYGNAEACRRFVRHDRVQSSQNNGVVMVPLFVVLPDDEQDDAHPSVREVESLIRNNNERLATRLERMVFQETKRNNPSTGCSVLRITSSSLEIGKPDGSAATRSFRFIPWKMMISSIAIFVTTLFI